MKFNNKKIKKQAFANIISPDFIAGDRFEDIIKMLKEQSTITHRDRYLYGYSLLRQQQPLAALAMLWPLITKGYPSLQEDCLAIAAEVFKDIPLLTSETLSDEALYTLVLVAKSLAPQSHAYHILKQRCFEGLWQKGAYEKLEQFLKSFRDECSGVMVENLSKLTFLQAKTKLNGNPNAFASYVLTGGACLIARNAFYHHDIADALQLLAAEIKDLFIQNKSKLKGVVDFSWFENFVDYEANILTQILQLAIKNQSSNIEIIAAPVYIMTYDANKRISQTFLPWLANENKALFEMYTPDVCRAVLWALGMDQSSTINTMVKLVQQHKLDPYLRLALLLRAENNKKPHLRGIVQISDFENLDEGSNIFKKLTIQIVGRLLTIEQPTEFVEIVCEFYPVLQAPELKNILIKQSLKQLFKRKHSLNFEPIKTLVRQVNDLELEKQVEVYIARQQACLQFLVDIKDKKRSEQRIKNIKNKSALEAHFILVSDAFQLISDGFSSAFFEHLNSLVNNRKINKLISLKTLLGGELDCLCEKCQMRFYKHHLSDVIAGLTIPGLSLPDLHAFSNASSISQTSSFKSSALLQTDPFKVLEVSYTDSKQIIMQKVLKLIQQSPEKMSIFRQAQNELFTPAKRFVHHYLRSFANDTVLTETKQPLLQSPIPIHKIALRRELLDVT